MLGTTDVNVIVQIRTMCQKSFIHNQDLKSKTNNKLISKEAPDHIIIEIRRIENSII